MSRPYLEIKVVKAKKYIKKQVIKGRLYGYYYNKKGILCFEEIKPYTKPKQLRKGNFVNGENIDKIKFPCFCSYVDSENKKKFGMLNRYAKWYRLYNIEKQSKDNYDNFVDDCTSLRNLIKDYDIHILKGKIILFEEEE